MTDFQSIYQNPKVSVAIVTFNQKIYLRECIESCLAQDYQNFEIVVADDGSNDGTHEMLEEYSNAYPDKFILVLSKFNKGITINTNNALRSCRGDYIALMGGDDLMLPNKLAMQVSYMDKKISCDVCYHDMDVFDSESGKTLYLYGGRNKSRSGDVATVIAMGCINCASATMLRREKLPFFLSREELPVASDWMLIVDILISGGTIDYLPQVLGRYRRHKSNVTHSTSSLSSQGMRDVIRSCSICLEIYPRYSAQAMRRLTNVLREFRHLNNGEFYYPRIKASLFPSVGLKSFICFMVGKISMGRYRP